MAQKGQLYNVPPAVIAAEMQSQNGVGLSQSQSIGSFLPIPPNPEGYGLFGLGANTYHGPSLNGQVQSFDVSESNLTTTTQAGFAALAQVLSANIARLSQGNNGNLAQGIVASDDGNETLQALNTWGYPGAGTTVAASSMSWPSLTQMPARVNGLVGSTTKSDVGGSSALTPGGGGVSSTSPTGTPIASASTGGTDAGTFPASLLYDCYAAGSLHNAADWNKKYGSASNTSSCLISIPGTSWCFTECEAKAYVSVLLIFWGSVLGLVSLTMMFARGKGLLGKATELAGAGVALVPGGEAVGGAMMSAGHAVSTKTKAKAASQGAQKVVAKRQARQKASQKASQSASQSSSAPASRPRQHASSTPSQSQVNNMSPAQKRSLLQQHAKAGGAVSAGA